MMEFTVEEFTVFRVVTFLNEALRQIYGQIWTAKCDFIIEVSMIQKLP